MNHCKVEHSKMKQLSLIDRHGAFFKSKQVMMLFMMAVMSTVTVSVSAFQVSRSRGRAQLKAAGDQQTSLDVLARHSAFHSKAITSMPVSSYQRMDPLQMSTLGKDPEEANIKETLSRLKSKLKVLLPPPPEDQLSMLGDIGCLFLYSSIDHLVNRLYDKWLNSPEIIDTISASAAIQSASAASLEYSTNLIKADLTSKSFPVWFDAYSSAPFGNIPLSAALPIEHHITYAPAIDSTGMASVLLCSSWLISGYFTGAFQFKNTLNCSLNRAIVVTGQTWIFSSLIMLGIALGSDSLIGSVDCLHKSVGLTKADADYIFDSLSVLLMWRFILSSFLGYDDTKR